MTPMCFKTEQCIISILIQFPEYIQMVKNEGIRKDFFANDLHKRVFEHIISTGNSSIETLMDKYPSDSENILTLMTAAISGSNMPDWIATLKEYACRRRILGISDKMMHSAENLESNFREDLPKQLQVVLDNSALLENSNAIPMSEAVSEFILQQDNEPSIPEYINHGLPYDGSIRHGRKEIFTIGAIPGCGKTNLALSVALNLMKRGLKVAFFCQEMPFRDLFRRLIANESNVSISDIIRRRNRLGTRNAEDFFHDLANRNAFLIRGAGNYQHTASGIRSEIQRFYSETGGLDFIVIDYLQTMGAPKTIKGFRDRREIVDYNLEEIKAMANDFNAPVMLLSQLSRDGQKNTGNRMSSLKESAHIEEVSSIIAFLERQKGQPEDAEQIAIDFLCEKNRNGRRFKMSLYMEGAYCRFTAAQNYHKYGEEDIPDMPYQN